MILFKIAWLILIVFGCMLDTASNIPLFMVIVSVAYIAVYMVLNKNKLHKMGYM